MERHRDWNWKTKAWRNEQTGKERHNDRIIRTKEETQSGRTVRRRIDMYRATGTEIEL